MAAGLSAGVAFIDILPNMAGFSAGLTSGMRKASSAITSTGRTLTHTLTLPIALAAGAALKMSLDFQSSMTRIQTQAGASAGEVDRMSKALLNLAPSVATGPNQLAAGLYHIESVGYRAGKALDVLKTAAMGAKVGGADLEDTASALSGVLITNIKGTGNLSNAMGTLNGIIGSGNMRMGDLVQALKSGVVPTAKIAGLSLKGIGAALAMMTDEGVPATTAAMRLRTVLFMITDPTHKALVSLKSIGLTSTSLGHDMQKPDGILRAMQDLRTHLEGIKDPTKRLALIGSMFGGSRSAGTIAMLLNNLGRIKVKYDQISKVAGNYASEVAKTRQTNQFKIDQAWAGIQADLIKTGGILMPLAVQLADVFERWAEDFSKLSPEMQKVAIYGALIVAALGPLLTIVGTLGTLWGVLSTVLLTVGVGLTTLLDLLPGVTVALVEGEGAAIAFGTALDVTVPELGLLAIGIGAVTLAAGLISGVFSSGGGAADQLAGAAKRAQDAIDGLNGAMKNSHDAQHQANEAFIQARGAVLAVKQAQQNYNTVLKTHKKDSLAAKQAENQLEEAEANRYDTNQRAVALQEKANRQANKAAQTYRTQKTAIGDLINKTRQVIDANNKSASSAHTGVGAYLLMQQATQKNSKAATDLAKHLQNMADGYGKAAAEARSRGNPALAATETHLQKVAQAAQEVAARINNIPTKKQISIQLQIDAVVSEVTGGGPHGYAGNPHAGHGGKTGKNTASGGPVVPGMVYKVGERGEELFAPNVRGHVLSNSSLRAGLGQAGGGRYNITIDNWDEGTGHMEHIADSSVDGNSRLQRTRSRMRRNPT